MGNISAIIKILEVFALAVQYVWGLIDKARFQARLDAIDAAVSKAKEGPIEERLKGGQDLEDEINSNTK